MWEGIKNLKHMKKAIADFHKKHSEAPKRLSAAVFMSLPCVAKTPLQTPTNTKIKDEP
jgi:hypothetical protein